jgi:integrase
MKRAVDTREPERVERGDFDDVFEWIDKEIGHAESDLDGAPWILDRALLRYLDILGLRIHEACGIRLSHFRRHGRELRVSITGKGGRIDEFPVVGSLLEAHRSWLRVRDTVQPAQGHEDYLFLNVSRKKGYGHVVSRQRAWERLKRIAANLGWDAERRSLLSPHAFRHGRAFEMLDSGMYNIEEVRAYLRHRSVVTTQGYVEATRDSVHRAAREQAGA